MLEFQSFDGAAALDDVQQLQMVHGTGVLSGCAATLPSSTSPIQVDVASGTAYVNNTAVSFGGGSVSLPDGDAQHPRKDIVYIDGNGALQSIQGIPRMPQSNTATPGTDRETYQPEPPDLSSLSSIGDAAVVAEIWVPSAATSTADMTDSAVTYVRDRRLRPWAATTDRDSVQTTQLYTASRAPTIAIHKTGGTIYADGSSDSIASGTDAATVFQAAFDYLHDNGLAGIVAVDNSTYEFSTPVQFWAGITLHGSGYCDPTLANGTVLKQTSDPLDPILWGQGVSYTKIKNICFTGDSKGIEYRNAAQHSVLEDVFFKDLTGRDILLEADTNNSYNHHWRNIHINNTTEKSVENINIGAGSNLVRGLYWQGRRVNGSVTTRNVNINGLDESIIANVRVENPNASPNPDGFLLNDVDYTTFIRPVFDGVDTAFDGTTNLAWGGVRIWDPRFVNTASKWDGFAQSRLVVGNEAQESANAEEPQMSWPTGTLVDFTDSGDGSGSGVYLARRDGSYTVL